MDTLLRATTEAIQLLTGFDPALLAVLGLTLRVTGGALLLAVVMGVPVGAWLGLRGRVPLAGCLLPLIYTGMGLPPSSSVSSFISSSPIRGHWAISIGSSLPTP